MAEVTINELRARLAEKNIEVEDVRKRSEDLRDWAMQQAASDRSEIERLAKKLFEKDDTTVQNLKVRLA